MSVVKPVWNVPMAGTLYWLVTMRGCNADRCVLISVVVLR